MERKLRQQTEYGRLKEVIIGKIDEHYSLPPKSASSASYTEHITTLKDGFYDQFEVGEQILIKDKLPEAYAAVETMLKQLKEGYEKEGVRVLQGEPSTPFMRNYWGYVPHGFIDTHPAAEFQVYGDVLVESIVSNNCLETAAGQWTVQRIYREKFKQDKNVIWFSMPAAYPFDFNKPGVNKDKETAHIHAADVRMVDEKNLIVGIGFAPGQESAASSNLEGADIFKRVMEKFGYNVHIARYDANITYHMDYIYGVVAPKLVALPINPWLDGLPEVLKEHDIVELPLEEVGVGGCNLVSLGPDDNGNYRVMGPKEELAPTLHAELAKRNVRVIGLDTKIPAELMGAARCATLVTLREDSV